MSEVTDNGSPTSTPPVPAPVGQTGAVVAVDGPPPADTPFQPAVVATSPALPFGPAATPAPVVGPQPKRPPLRLAGPGQLTGAEVARPAAPSPPPAASPVATPPPAPPPATPPIAEPVAPAPVPPAPAPPATPPVSPPAATSDAAPITGSPWQSTSGGSPAIPPGGAPVDAVPPAPPAGAGRPGDHPLAVTNSPWETTANVDAELLPSANVLQAVGEPASAPEPPAEIVAPARGSRLGMTIGLGVAALALIAAVVYFTMFDKHGDQDPADVKVGSEQRDYGDEPLPSASASASAKPAHRVPHYRPPRPVHKASKPDDIYDDL